MAPPISQGLTANVTGTAHTDQLNLGNKVEVNVNLLPPKPSDETFLGALFAPFEETVFSGETVSVVWNAFMAYKWPREYFAGFAAGTIKTLWKEGKQSSTPSSHTGEQKISTTRSQSWAERINSWSLTGRITTLLGAGVTLKFLSSESGYTPTYDEKGNPKENFAAGSLTAPFSGYFCGRDLTSWVIKEITEASKT